MACILKIPTQNSKGILTFTTPEWRHISSNKNLLDLLGSLRSFWVTGLHFNWHDYQFKPLSQFDFFMAGEQDLRPVDQSPYRLLPMDACNFTPASYRPAPTREKFWDVLIVGNPVFFKRPEVVLQTIRKLFDTVGYALRVLYVCPLPKYKFSNEDSVLYDVRAYYESLFTAEERASFTLLTTDFDSPNPFDRNTLSVFFRNSKVFLHCATEERRCRIAAYAWCAGLPVVAYPAVASILPESLRTVPGYFSVNSDDQYVPQLIAAIRAAPDFDPALYQFELSESCTVQKLEAELQSIFQELGLPYEGTLIGQNLDRRLGWHHEALGGLANGVRQPLNAFMRAALGLRASQGADMQAMLAHAYPEKVLANELDDITRPLLQTVVQKSIYLNPRKKFWFRAFGALKSKTGLG